MLPPADIKVREWRPAPWLPIALALFFAWLIVVALIAGAGWRSLAVLGGLFALCFQVAFSGYRAYPGQDS